MPPATGALFLVVGELDRKVPPESTLRFVTRDRQTGIRLADHSQRRPGAGGDYNQRRMRDFFVRHLQGELGGVSGRFIVFQV
jgi:hypothetical protein